MIFIALTQLTRAQESLEDVIERVEGSVIRIEVDGAEGQSLGSGFIIDNQGTFVTNCHVLAGARTAIAFFPNGTKAEILGTMLIDETRDIAVGRISHTAAPPIEFAANLPRKGEQVIALGAPLGLAFSASKGIVSAIRSAQEMRSDVNRNDVDGTWIQVDTPLSPGNSGGPLINSAGQLVGMSTLASGGGRAQNLNFGISVNDVRNAIKYARGARMLTLSMGAGKIRTEESSSPSGPGGGEGGLARREIPKDILGRFVSSGVRDYEKYMAGLRTERNRMSSELSQMKNGRTFIPPQWQEEDVAVVKAKIAGSKNPVWFFQDEDTKRSTIERQQERIKKVNELQNSLRGKTDANSVVELLKNSGPALDTKRNNSIGFAQDIIVLHAFNKHDVIVIWEEKPYLLYMKSTAGLFPGELLSVPVMVAGTEVIQSSRSKSLTSSVTVLQEVTEDDLRQAAKTLLGYRVWRSGQHSVEAKLLDWNDDDLTLQKRDGSTVKVPRSKINPEDLEGID